MRLVPKFVAGLFAPIAASILRLDEEYLAAEVKRQRMKEIVRVVQVAHAQELREVDVPEWRSGYRSRSSASLPPRQTTPAN
jgi:hypothetical protein